MTKYRRPLAILLAQLALFYLLPLAAKPLGAMGMVLLLIAATFALSFLMGAAPIGKERFLYPLLVAAAFIPSVFLYYNESALVQAVWYLVISGTGTLAGALSKRN